MSGAGQWKFTIVTSTYNAGDALRATARSLEKQLYKNFEWIIIDGASTDGTVDLARGFGSLVTKLISEPDTGIYSALNKALPFVSGDWVLFLGAGDELYSKDTLGTAAALLANVPAGASIAYGDVAEIDMASARELGLRHETWVGLDGPWCVGRPALPSHQGVFHRASLFSAGFRFDTRCRISADNEVVLRELINGHGVKLPVTVARFVVGGMSYVRSNRLRMIAESIYINIKVGIFFRRPVYQLAVLASNLVKHVPRVLGFKI